MVEEAKKERRGCYGGFFKSISGPASNRYVRPPFFPSSSLLLKEKSSSSLLLYLAPRPFSSEVFFLLRSFVPRAWNELRFSPRIASTFETIQGAILPRRLRRRRFLPF